MAEDDIGLQRQDRVRRYGYQHLLVWYTWTVDSNGHILLVARHQQSDLSTHDTGTVTVAVSGEALPTWFESSRYGADHQLGLCCI